MSRHPYEYKMLVEYLTPVPSSITPHYTERRDEESLTLALNDAVKHLPNAIEEGFDVHSHGLTIVENTIILSVLLRRHRQ
jgi:hypothetical protein